MHELRGRRLNQRVAAEKRDQIVELGRCVAGVRTGTGEYLLKTIQRSEIGREALHKVNERSWAIAAERRTRGGSPGQK